MHASIFHFLFSTFYLPFYHLIHLFLALYLFLTFHFHLTFLGNYLTTFTRIGFFTNLGVFSFFLLDGLMSQVFGVVVSKSHHNRIPIIQERSMIAIPIPTRS